MAWEDVTGENPNLTRFLAFLGKSEGADWNTVVGGKKFSDFSQHPNVVGLTTPDGPSTAAGKYQITGTTYRDVAPKIGVNDFSPESQNQVAIELIRRNGALDDVLAGNYEPAIKKLGGVWASLPSSNYNQPKRDWNFVKANLTNSSADDGWETVSPAAKSDAGWETVTPASPNEPARGRPTMQNDPRIVDPNQPAPTNAPQRSALDNLKRNLELGTRDVLVGAEKAATFPVRAGADFAAGVLGLAGGGNTDVYKYLTGLGLKGKGVGDMASDAANLATPETSREKLVSAGVQAAAGLPIGSVVNKIAEKSPQAVQGIMSVLMPGTGGTAGQVIKDAALTGAAGAGFEAAPAETLGVLALAGAGKAAVGAANQSRKVTTAIEKAGSNEDAALVAEIGQALKREFDNPARKGMNGNVAPLSPQEMNQRVTKGFIDEAKVAVQQLPKDFESKADLMAALNKGVNISQPALERLKDVKGGEEVANVIFRAQKADAMTKQMLQDPTLMGHAIRIGIDSIPPVIGGAIGGLPGAAIGSLFTKVVDPLAKKATGKMTRTEVGQSVINKVSGLSEDILARTGSSKASQATTALNEMAAAAKQASGVKTAVNAAPVSTTDLAKTLADTASVRQAMGLRGQPLSNAYNTVLSRSGATNEQAIPILRKLAKDFKGNEIGIAADELRRSGNVTNEKAFYSIQDILRDSAKANGGVLSQASAGAVKGNKISSIINKLPDDQVAALLGRSTDTLDKTIKSQKAYLTTRASRAMETYKASPDKLPTEDLDLLKALGLVK